ncbi:MAG: transketolase [Saprospiraceae bacterium]
MKDIQELKKISSQVRRDIVRMVHACQSGHPGGSLGCTDFMVALYFHFLRYRLPFSMEGHGEDMFFLSNGHISPVWYSVLARSGFFPTIELATFRKINSRLQGHPATHEGLPGIRVASGSLGQGLSVAIGAALAKRLDGDQNMIYVLTGDGELEEGQVWEAIMSAAHYKLDNIIVTVDWNGQQIDGPTNEIMSLGDLEAKWKSFGWHVLHMDGNVIEDVIKTFEHAREQTGKKQPVVILMKTVMGFGVDFMMGGHHWHGIAPNDEQLIRALTQLEETAGDY